MVSTHLKNISQIGSFPQNRGKNKKYLKPPPRDEYYKTFTQVVFRGTPCLHRSSHRQNSTGSGLPGLPCHPACAVLRSVSNFGLKLTDSREKQPKTQDFIIYIYKLYKYHHCYILLSHYPLKQWGEFSQKHFPAE